MTLISTRIDYVVIDFLQQVFVKKIVNCFVFGKEPSEADTLRHMGTLARNVSFLALFMSELDPVEWVWHVRALAMVKRFTSSDLVLSLTQ